MHGGGGAGCTRSRASELFSTRKTCSQERLCVLSYRAALDVPIAAVRTVSGWLTASPPRPRHPTPPTGGHHLDPGRPGVAVAQGRHRCAGPGPRAPGSRRPSPTANTREAREAIAQRSPDITDVLDRLRRRGEPFVCLDGTVVRTDRVAARTEAGSHLWYACFAQGLQRQRAGFDRSHGGPGVDRARGVRLDP